MSKEYDLKRLLRNAATASRKPLDEQQLHRAAQELVKKAHVSEADVRSISESVTRDPDTFAVVDIDDINDVLARGQ